MLFRIFSFDIWMYIILNSYTHKQVFLDRYSVIVSCAQLYKGLQRPLKYMSQVLGLHIWQVFFIFYAIYDIFKNFFLDKLL